MRHVFVLEEKSVAHPGAVELFSYDAPQSRSKEGVLDVRLEEGDGQVQIVHVLVQIGQSLHELQNLKLII